MDRGTAPDHGGGKPEGEKPSALVSPITITTQEQADSLVRTYAIPEGVTVAYVTEDRSVFWQQNKVYAYNHAHRNNLKIFTCQDLAK